MLRVNDITLFTSNSTKYLFIQGGSAGTSDDGLIKIGGLSAHALTDIGSAIEITFSGGES